MANRRFLVTVALVAIICETSAGSWFWGSSTATPSVAEPSLLSAPSVEEAAAPAAVEVAKAEPVVEEVKKEEVEELVKSEVSVQSVSEVQEPKGAFEYVEKPTKKKSRKAKKQVQTDEAENVPAAPSQTEEAPKAEESVGFFGWLWGGSKPVEVPAPAPVTEEKKEEAVAAASESVKDVKTPVMSRKERRLARQQREAVEAEAALKEKQEAEEKEKKAAAEAEASNAAAGGWFSYLWGSTPNNVATTSEVSQQVEGQEGSIEDGEGEDSQASVETRMSSLLDYDIDHENYFETVQSSFIGKPSSNRPPRTIRSVKLKEQSLSSVEKVMQTLCRDPDCSTYKFVKLSNRILKRIDDLAEIYGLEKVASGPGFRTYRRTRMGAFKEDSEAVEALIAADQAETKPTERKPKTHKYRQRRYNKSTKTSEAVEEKRVTAQKSTSKDIPHAQKRRTQLSQQKKSPTAKRNNDRELITYSLDDDEISFTSSYSTTSSGTQYTDSDDEEDWEDFTEEEESVSEDEDEALKVFPRRPKTKGPTYLDAAKGKLAEMRAAEAKRDEAFVASLFEDDPPAKKKNNANKKNRNAPKKGKKKAGNKK